MTVSMAWVRWSSSRCRACHRGFRSRRSLGRSAELLVGRWPAAAATRTWGRARGGDQATRPLRLGSPRGRRAGKSQARVQERGARPGGRPVRWRRAPAMSQGLQLLLLGCGMAPSPSPQSARDPAWLALLTPVCLSLFLTVCSLAPAMAMREVTVACSETADLPCTAPWDPQLSYTVSWAKVSAAGRCLRGPLWGEWKQTPKGWGLWGSGLGIPPILTPYFLPPLHPGPKPPLVLSDHDQRCLGVNDSTRGFQGIRSMHQGTCGCSQGAAEKATWA